MKRPAPCSTVVLALAAMGCGGSSARLGATMPTDDGGSQPMDAAVDRFTGDDGPGGHEPEGGMDTGAPLPYFGKVQFIREDQGTMTAYEVLGQILPTGTWWSALACPPGSDTSGSCCYIPGGGDAGSMPFESVSAGTMTIALGGMTFATLTYDAQMMQYSLFSAITPPAMTSWNGGDMLQVSAAGAMVNAFSGSVAMPTPLQGLSVTPNHSPTVSLSKDWTVTWTPEQSTSKVVLAMYGAGGEIKCVEAATMGAVTMPAAFLGHFQLVGSSDVFVESVSTTTLYSANAVVEIAAFNQVFDLLTLQP